MSANEIEKILSWRNNYLLLWLCLLFFFQSKSYLSFWGSAIPFFRIQVTSTKMVIEIECTLNAGGHGYSFVFPVNIWGATWWGKLMQKQPTYLWKDIYCINDFIACYSIRLFSWEYLLRKFGQLNILFPFIFLCDIVNLNMKTFLMHVLVIWTRSYRVVCRLHGLFQSHDFVYRNILFQYPIQLKCGWFYSYFNEFE